MKTLIMKSLIVLMSMLFASTSFAGEIISKKDWTAETGTLAEFGGKSACIAYTTVTALTGEVSRLEVVQLKGQDGKFSYPFVMSSTAEAAVEYFEALAKTDRNKKFKMPLLNLPANQNAPVVAVEMDERINFLSRLRRDNFVNMSFKNHAGEVISKRFSLRGSSVVINKMLATCN